MPKRRDENQTAFAGLQELIRRDAARDGTELPPEPEPQKNPASVKAGRRTGHLGGKARAKNLSAKKRSQIARKAAKARWNR